MTDEEEFSARSQLKWTWAPTGKLMFQITGAFAQTGRGEGRGARKAEDQPGRGKA